MAKKNIPTGVKVISVLYYIGAVFLLLFGIALFVAAGFADQIASTISEQSGLGTIIATFGAVGGIVLIAFAVLSFFIGRGLWKAQSWARIVAGIFAVLGVLSALMSLITGSFGSIIGLIVHGWIGWYLFFNSTVKKAFA